MSGADGRPHPYIVDFGYISVDGTYGKHMPYTTRMRKLDLKGTGTVQVTKGAANGLSSEG